ncbi:MAG: T9SS type A sorting domain-containing protein, partial [Bacteroidales bacterium]|nr:T9SS type A sorting domain-containing protein [Bacteroidales bacterium]
MTFMYKVSSETNYDKFFFYMDNQLMNGSNGYSGVIDWTQYVQAVTTGQHTFKWEYHKDSSVNSNDDCIYIDDIVFPIVNVFTFIAPATDLDAQVEGGNVTLRWNASADADKYVVKRDGETVGETTGTTYDDVLPHDGIYTYAVYAAKNTGSMSTPVMVTIEAEFDGIVDAQEISVSVYPNPANGVLNIVTDANNYEYQVINSVGQVVMSGNASGRTSLNVETLNGVYFLRIIADGDVIVRKVTVK